MRTQSTITTSITFSHRVRQTVCPHPRVRMLHRPRVASSSRPHASTRSSDAMRAMRCVRHSIRGDSRPPRPALIVHRNADRRAFRPRVMSHRAVAVPTARWIRGDADGRRRRRVAKRVSPRTRFEDSTSRARLEARARTKETRARAETRDGGGVARARGARTRARRRGAARSIKIKRRRATRLEDERDRTTERGRMRLARDDEEIGLTR